MTVVRINAITVPEGSGDELARRFAHRAGAVEGTPGFEGFDLLRPTDGRRTWLVVTRWRDEAAFRAWTESPAFAHGHRGATEKQGERPVAVHAELWSYDVVDVARPGPAAGHPPDPRQADSGSG
ncbi:MAG TPA: antibiotic biosynthesis monooxygenase [Acidimicrobiales bacterium]|nr:antibiotic biosynthesis monooxygenase [Acidimicrobiales bacterium]